MCKSTCTTEKVGKKKLKLNLKPWITNKIIKMMHHRDRLFSKWNNDRLNAYFQNAYKKFRNRTRQEIRKSKREYYDNYFKIHKSNMKKLWAGIRSIVNTKQRSRQLISQIKSDGKDYDNPKDIANIFNKFFVNVADNVQKSIPSAPKSHKDYLKKPSSRSIFLYPCTPKRGRRYH